MNQRSTSVSAVKPIYKITANGNDIDLGKRLISLRVSDESGIKSDSCEIVLDDRDSSISIPSTGANISVYMGYAEGPLPEDVGLSHMGSYTVNEISISGAPNKISIKAHAADLKSTLKEKVSGSFIGKTIGDLVGSIASKHGLIPKVSGDLASIVLGHLDQTGESDMHLLTRLASQYGAIAKPANGALLFAAQGLAKSISGIALGTTTIDMKQVISWTYTEAERENYGKVRRESHDFESGDISETVVGAASGAIYSAITSSDKNNAEAIAKAMLRGINKSAKKLQIATVGNTNLIAESRITLTGFKQGIPTFWVISKAEHSLDSSGFRTNIDCVEFLEQAEETCDGENSDGKDAE